MAPTIAANTNPGELLIAPPDIRNPGAWADRGSFLCRQQLTAYAYAPWLAERILDRARWYLDAPVEDTPAGISLLSRMGDGYRARDSSDFAQLHRGRGVRLAIVEADQRLEFA